MSQTKEKIRLTAWINVYIRLLNACSGRLFICKNFKIHFHSTMPIIYRLEILRNIILHFYVTSKISLLKYHNVYKELINSLNCSMVIRKS